MSADASQKTAWILILEILFAGSYISLTRGLFVIYLASTGYGIEGISFVTLSSAIASTIFGILLYKRPLFITKKTKAKLVIFHALERVIWILIPLAQTMLAISLLYSIQLVSSSIISTFISYIIYGSFTEDTIREVTAKRSAANGVSSIMGFIVGTALLTLLPPQNKFKYIFTMGALVGLISTLIISMLDLSHLERKELTKSFEEPEKIFSSSFFSIIFLSGSNFLGIAWAPYIIRRLGGADYIASLMNLVGTTLNIIASLFWRRKTFKMLRKSLILNALGPILILSMPWPMAHIAINAYTSFTYSGASFIPAFLFARYNKWFGAVRSSILLAIFNNCAQIIASSIGLLISENFMAIFLVALTAKVIAALLASFVIPETAIVPENLARTYSQILYNSSLMGYNLGIELSKETIIMALRLLAFLSAIITLYIIYYILWLLMSLR